MEKIQKVKNHCTFIGAHVAGAPTYTPAFLQNGTNKQIRQMCTMNIYDGNVKFKMTGWGKMADIMAKSCTTGKKVTIECSAKPFMSTIPTPGLQPGQPLTFVCGADQQPILTEKTGFTVQTIDFGADSNKTATEEIQKGMRPPLWNVLGHADNNQWLNVICAQRNAAVFVPGGARFEPGTAGFGFARVRQPNGTIIDPATIVNTRQATAPVNTGTAVVNNGFNQPADQTAPAPAYQQTAPVNTGTAGFQGVQQQPVMVQGQNMGYAQAPVAPAQTYQAANTAPVYPTQPMVNM